MGAKDIQGIHITPDWNLELGHSKSILMHMYNENLSIFDIYILTLGVCQAF